MHWNPFQKVIKVGDSLAVIIPKPLARGLEVQRGDLVSITVESASIMRVRLHTPAEIEQIIKNNPTLNNDPAP